MFVDLPITDRDKAEVAARLFAHIENRTTDMAAEVMEIDPAVYRDPDVARREREEIFANVPVIAAHGSELPAPNDFVVTQLPNNEAVLVRQPDGGVRAFVNVCRHRGARLVTDDLGSRRVFSCGYHGWSYNPDGALRSVANAETFGEVDTACMGLVQLPAEERHGCVWVVDSPEATIDVADWLGPEMDQALAAFELDTYTCYRKGVFEEGINWKVLMDAFVDGYHITATHGTSVAPHFYNNTQTFEQLGRHARVVNPRKSIDKVRALPPAEAPIDRHVTVAHWIMPNVNYMRQPDHFELLTFLPHPTEATRCKMEMRILTREPATTDEERSRWDKNWDILLAVLRDEDLVMNRNLQRAVGNRDVAPLVIGRNEQGNQLFHRWLQRALDDPRHQG